MRNLKITQYPAPTDAGAKEKKDADRKKIGSVKEQRDREDMQAKLERQQAILEYVAAMADIDLPVEASEDIHTE